MAVVAVVALHCVTAALSEVTSAHPTTTRPLTTHTPAHRQPTTHPL
jgi:hypothetical protein